MVSIQALSMHFEYYGFHEKPFNVTSDPRFMYLSKTHKEAMVRLTYGITTRAGLMSLTGEVGTGKTTILRTLLDQISTDLYKTAMISNPCQSPLQLLRVICRELNIKFDDRTDLLEALNQFLLEQSIEGRTVVLAIDEAQNLDSKVLEQIRLISNFETTRDKLIQFILAGQPELLKTLARKDCRRLNQRITIRCRLQPLDLPTTVEYINFRLAAARGKAVFTLGAAKYIHRYARGYPRLINAACERLLLTGSTSNEIMISARTAKACIKDLKSDLFPGRTARRMVLGTAFISIILIAAAYIIYIKSLGPVIDIRTPQLNNEIRGQAPQSQAADPFTSHSAKSNPGCALDSNNVRS